MRQRHISDAYSASATVRSSVKFNSLKDRCAPEWCERSHSSATVSTEYGGAHCALHRTLWQLEALAAGGHCGTQLRLAT